MSAGLHAAALLPGPPAPWSPRWPRCCARRWTCPTTTPPIPALSCAPCWRRPPAPVCGSSATRPSARCSSRDRRGAVRRDAPGRWRGARSRRARRSRRVVGRPARHPRRGAHPRAPGQGPDHASARPRGSGGARAAQPHDPVRDGLFSSRGATGRYVLGATMEEQGFDTTVTAGAAHELIRDATELVPGVSELVIDDFIAGLRPSTPDNAPVLGPHPACPGLFYATGHHRNGTLLGPLHRRPARGPAPRVRWRLTRSPRRASRPTSPPRSHDLGSTASRRRATRAPPSVPCSTPSGSSRSAAASPWPSTPRSCRARNGPPPWWPPEPASRS